MRILLINPPRSPANAIYDCAPRDAQRLIHRKLIGPPLGLLTLASLAKADHDVFLLEMKGEYDLNPTAPEPVELLRQWLARTRPDLVGITCIASEFPESLKLLTEVKAWNPEVLTVAGGLHAQLCPEQFDHPAVDVISVSQAPQVFRDLLRAHEAGQPLTSVPGLVLRWDGKWQATTGESPYGDPAGTDYVAPDRSLVRPWLSTYIVGRATGPSTYLFSSLGCPHRCTFCSIWPQFDGAYHQREVESVVQELKTLDEYEVVRFADGNSLARPQFMDRLFSRIAEEGLEKRFKYVMDIRVDTAVEQPALIEKLARAGLVVAITGFESFRDVELEAFDKQSPVDKIAEAVSIFHANGVGLRGNYVVSPDYDQADFHGLAEFAQQHAVALAGYTILTPMPGTALYRRLLPQIVDHDLGKFNFFNCVMQTKLPLSRFYEAVGELWKIRQGSEVI
jgi:radical SAM superfamily enzyme YgiQ (UPF0313 family)